MNIFILDQNQINCAVYACDQHLNKMILESAQMLCTALNEKGMRAPYKSFNPKHPCCIWVMQSLSNWKWLRDHATNLEKERQYRFGPTRRHRSIEVIMSLPEPPIPDIGLTPFAQAMDEEYRGDDPVIAYRKYYIGKKSRFATWTKRESPEWFSPSFLYQ